MKSSCRSFSFFWCDEARNWSALKQIHRIDIDGDFYFSASEFAQLLVGEALGDQ
jgi:hypothetical protein